MSSYSLVELKDWQLEAICTSLIFGALYPTLAESRDKEFMNKSNECARKIIEKAKKGE